MRNNLRELVAPTFVHQKEGVGRVVGNILLVAAVVAARVVDQAKVVAVRRGRRTLVVFLTGRIEVR